jgi:SAM-dependent methyltransferase
LANSNDRPLCDYEGSRYRTEFWEGQGRDYEDAAERIALRQMLPAASERMVELGAGFGRLTDLYAPYKQVVLLDYSRSILEEAQQRLGDDPRFVFVVGNIYDLPFADGAFDTVAMIRVIHHLAEPLVGLREIRRIIVGGGHLVLEHANKRNLKAILRYLALRRGPSPFSLAPWEFVPLNFDFHPRHIENLLSGVGFRIVQRRSVSILRVGALKRLFPARVLAALDGLLQAPTAPLKLGPSIFLKTVVDAPPAAVSALLFRCPECHTALPEALGEVLNCPGCGRRWSRQGGIYDFKTPIMDAE